MCQLCISSLLPKSRLSSSCQLSKSHRLPFDYNTKRSLHDLELKNYDIWGPTPLILVRAIIISNIFMTIQG